MKKYEVPNIDIEVVELGSIDIITTSDPNHTYTPEDEF